MKTTMKTFALTFLTATMLAACGGGGSSSTPPVAMYAVGGTVAGLTGTGLVLQDNGAADLSVAADGGFTFGPQLVVGCRIQRHGEDAAQRAGSVLRCDQRRWHGGQRQRRQRVGRVHIDFAALHLRHQ